MAEVVKGYKGFDKDFCCRGYRFEVGKTHVHEGEVVLCQSGFHFCKFPEDVLSYYNDFSSRYAEIEASGTIVSGEGKCVCSEIRIVRELTRKELLECMPDGMRTCGNGDKMWYVNGKQHRDGDLPAMECADGSKFWYVNGKQHRDGDLPAVEYANGHKEWWVDDKLHRDGGLPAVEWVDGSKFWYKDGKRYRDGGLPAVEWANGNKEWYVNGVRVK